MTWLPWPAAPPASLTRTRPRSSRIGAPSSSRSAMTRTNARRPSLLVTSSPRTARSTGRRTSRRPARRRIAGRTNSSNVTTPDTGLPGRPTMSTGGPPPGRSAVPNANGLPGWTATRQRSIVPMVSIAAFDDVERPDRHAARDDDRVRAVGQAPPQARQDVVEHVGRDAQVDDVGAGRGAPGPAGPGRSRRGCRPGRAARRAPGPRRRSPGPRRAAAGGRRSPSTPAPASRAIAAAPIASPGSRSVAPSTEVAAGRADRAPGTDDLVDLDRRRQRPGRIATARAGPAVASSGVVARPGRPRRRHRAGGRRSRSGPPSRAATVTSGAKPARTSPMTSRRGVAVGGRPRRVRGPDRVAVHRGVRPRRQRRRRDGRLGGDPTERLVDRERVPCRSAGPRPGPRPEPPRRSGGPVGGAVSLTTGRSRSDRRGPGWPRPRRVASGGPRTCRHP